VRYKLSTLQPSPFHWNGREGYKPRWIILHGTAGPGAVSWFQNPQSNVSANYVVERDGSVVCCVEEEHAAWGNGVLTKGHASFWDERINPNLVTISIEHTKLTNDNSDRLTTAQQNASFALIQDICLRHAIPGKEADAQGGITGHYSLDPINRSRCPGPYPWNELWAFLKRSEVTVLQIHQASTFFVEVEPGKRWRCKMPSSYDGKYYEIAHALLDFYRSFGQVALNGLSIFGLPLSGEIRVPDTKSAIIQRCERGVMLYDPHNELDKVPGLPGPCYPAHIDKAPGQDPRLAALTKQIEDLQQQLKQSPTALALECEATMRSLKPLVERL
jgi:N-acetyl-anhydromuramyl-L-alanine amidase AmpD